MSHATGVRCGKCHEVLEPDTCPEGCAQGHGHVDQDPDQWAARTWPNHECFAVIAAEERPMSDRLRDVNGRAIDYAPPGWMEQRERERLNAEARDGTVCLDCRGSGLDMGPCPSCDGTGRAMHRPLKRVDAPSMDNLSPVARVMSGPPRSHPDDAVRLAAFLDDVCAQREHWLAEAHAHAMNPTTIAAAEKRIEAAREAREAFRRLMR